MRFDPQDPIWPDRDRFVLSKRARLNVALVHPALDRCAGCERGV